MAASTAAVTGFAPADGRSRRGRLLLAGGARTTIHVACHDADRTEIRVAVLPGQERLEPWCARHGIREALVGGFFVRPDGTPLGEVRTHGVVREHVPFDAPWHAIRACVHVEGGAARIARRDRLDACPRGDLLQAGPLLVADREVAYDPEADDEGFRAAAHQFDPDPTDGRHPRAALGMADGRIVAVACDGRSRRDAGLTLRRAREADARAGLRARAQPRRRRLDRARSPAAGSRTSRGATSRSPSRAGARSRRRSSSVRCRAR